MILYYYNLILELSFILEPYSASITSVALQRRAFCENVNILLIHSVVDCPLTTTSTE